MATPHNPCEAPRETTEQDVPLARQQVVRRDRDRSSHRPGRISDFPFHIPAMSARNTGGEREVEPPA